MSGLELIDKARQAGFSDTEIFDGISRIGSKAVAAGFSPQEVLDYYGMKDVDETSFSSMFAKNISDFHAAQPAPEATAQPAAAKPKPLSLVEAMNVGFSNSTTGLMVHGKVSDQALSDSDPWYNKVASSATQAVGDLPTLVGGTLVGMAGAAETGPLAPALGFGVGMAFNENVRQSLIDSYKNGAYKSFGDWWDRILPIAAHTAKAGIEGASMVFAGGSTAATVGKAIAPMVENKTISAGTAMVAETASKLAAEYGTMVNVGAALDGKIPSAKDFEDGAYGFLGAIVGMKAAEVAPEAISKTKSVLMDTFVKTGKSPAEVVVDAKADPTIHQDIVQGNVPKSYDQFQTKQPEQTTQKKEDGVTQPVNDAAISAIITPPEIAKHLENEFGGDATSLLDAGKVKIVQSVEELNNLTNAQHPDDVRGMYDPVSDTTFLVADNLNPEEGQTLGGVVKGVALHEVGVHSGMEEMLGPDLYAKVLDTVNKNQEEPFVNARRAAEENANRPEHVPEETLAYLVENHQDLPIVKQLLANVRQWLYRKTGGRFINLTDADIASMAVASLRRKARQAAIESGSGEPWYSRGWHGSPFKFDRFSTDYIGTGEGAQAYGWGLYIAGKKRVGEHYRDILSENKNVLVDGEQLDLSNPQHVAAYALSNFSGKSDLAINNLQHKASRDSRNRALYYEAIGLIEDGAKMPTVQTGKGYLYETEIPEDNTMLHWDKPLTDQPALVKNSLQGIKDALGKKYVSEVENKLNADFDEWTGKELYKAISRYASEDALPNKSDTSGNFDRDASEYLHSIGINGIKYLDGSSRAAGDGSHNYVVFHDNNVKITARYSRKSENIPFGKNEKVRAASIEDVKKADEFERKNGIRPYYSEGQIEVSVDVEPKYSIKPPYNEKDQAKGKRNHTIIGESGAVELPLNKNKTVTLYFPTTNDKARQTVLDKKLRADNPQANRIYLTNESSPKKILDERGNIEQEVGGANVLIHIDPSLLQLDQEFADGRKDFYIQLAEGQSFVNKMRQTKLFTLNKSRNEAISEDVTFKDIGSGIKSAIDEYTTMDTKSRQAAVREAKKILKEEHNVSTLLSENGKLQKTRVGDYGLDYEGNSVASMGLGLASAQKLNAKKLTTCLKSAICEALCLGETSGQNQLYGGEGAFRAGPRLSQYLKTEALVLHPKEFGILLSHEIALFKAWAQKSTGVEKVKNEATGEKESVPKQVYQSAIRLNVTSDFPPSVFESLMKAHPDVQFYDYTKLGTEKIADNHHLTYSSTGASQVVNGKEIFNPHSNWKTMVSRMNKGFNVAMAFSNRNVLPKFVVDEATGQKFKVWDGDQYDARFLDPPQEDGIGMVIGLTNKDRTGIPGLAAEKNQGFFIDYEPERDGDTVVIKDQSKFKAPAPEPATEFDAAGMKYSRANSDIRYSRRTPSERAILERISQDDYKHPSMTLDQVYTKALDDLNPIKNVSPDAYQLMRLVRGAYGKAQQFLFHGTYDFASYVTNGPGLKEILEPFKNDLDGLRAYMVSRRAVELEGRGITSGMPLTEANDVVASGDPKYRAAMQGLIDYQDRVLNYLRDAGVVSVEAYDAIKDANKSYVPFFRLMDNQPSGVTGNGRNVRNPVMRITGSERNVVDPIESIIKNTYMYVELAERNAANMKLADDVLSNPDLDGIVTKVPTPMRPVEISEEETANFLDEHGLDATKAEAFTIFRPAAVPLKDTEFMVYRDGKREIYETDKDIAAAVRSLDKESISLWMKLISYPAKTLRAGATLSPDFPLRNVFRDQISAFIFSKDGYTPFVTMAKGAMSLVAKDDVYQNWLKSGGANSALVSIDRQYINENVFKLNKQTKFIDSAWNVVKSPIQALRIISETLENATRLGEFKAASKDAVTKEDLQTAGMKSREITLDFARAGTNVKSLNMISAFFNASLQGTDRTVRAIKDDPVMTMAKIGLSITLPSVLLWAANHDDDWVGPDGVHHNRWKEIPAWQRDLFWIVLTDNAVIRLPKPFELGVVFGSGVERALDAMSGDFDPKKIKEFLATAGLGILPNPTPTAAAPVLEHITNYSFLSEHDLVPSRLEKLLPELQYTEYTSEIAKFLSHVISTVPTMRDREIISPIVMENYLRSWTGGLGTYALKAVDQSLRKSGLLPDPVAPASTLADIPVVKAFVVRFPSASVESITSFQEEYGKRKKVLDSIKSLASSGDPNAIVMMSRFTPNEYMTLDSIHDALSGHTKLIRDYNKMDVRPDQKDNKAARDSLAMQKRQLIDNAYSNMIQMARMGNQIMKDIDKAFGEPVDVSLQPQRR